MWYSSRQMNDLSFQKSPDKSQIFYFLICIYIDLFIPVAILESDRLFYHAKSLQLAGDKGHTILPGGFLVLVEEKLIRDLDLVKFHFLHTA